jgi:superfamily II DNA/RNA helicase
MLFSATMPAEITQIANSYMKLPVRVEVAPSGSTIALVTQELFFVHRENKLALLQSLLTEYKGSVLVFTRTKFGAKKLTTSIHKMGHTAAEIHSNRSLNQRIEALTGFKVGKYRVLVATDIAARGIDVTGIELVINYDLPEQPGDYVHRIGRTGRAEHTGRAISFATPEQKFDVRAIERLIKKQLPVSPLPVLRSFSGAGPALPARKVEASPAPASGFTGFGRTPNRQAQESYGSRGRFRPSADPVPLRSPYSKNPHPGQGFGSQKGFSRFSKPDNHRGAGSRPFAKKIGAGFNGRRRGTPSNYFRSDASQF